MDKWGLARTQKAPLDCRHREHSVTHWGSQLLVVLLQASATHAAGELLNKISREWGTLMAGKTLISVRLTFVILSGWRACRSINSDMKNLRDESTSLGSQETRINLSLANVSIQFYWWITTWVNRKLSKGNWTTETGKVSNDHKSFYA